MNAVDVCHLTHSFGPRRALDDVTFSVPAGAFAVLLGLNGAGKSTLFSVITRLYHSQSGEVRVFGASLRRSPLAALAETGVVFQASTLDLDLTIRENLRYHGALHGLSQRETDARQDDELRRAGLHERLHDRVRSLSGGLRRRVELVRALLHRPRLLLLDEPTVGLDAAARREFLAYVRSLRDQRQVTVLWATHLMDEVDADDEVLLLHRGRLVRQASAGRLVRETESGSIAHAFAALTG